MVVAGWKVHFLSLSLHFEDLSASKIGGMINIISRVSRATLRPRLLILTVKPFLPASTLAMTSAGLGQQPFNGIKGSTVAACAFIHFYVREEPLNEAGPMLSRLLSYTTRLIFNVDAPSPNLDHFISLLAAALKESNDQDDDSQVTMWVQRVENLLRECSSFSGLHDFFTKVERLLITEELYDEIQNVTIKPADRKIDEQSPFGHYLQLCLDNYLSLEDDEFAKVVREFQGWVEGVEHATSSRDDVRHRGGVSSALKRGDYSLARAELEGFFDRSPLDSSHLSLQESLLKNAMFHYHTKAYESARASLDESLRLSRGVNDLTCISACDKLMRRIDYDEDSGMQEYPHNGSVPGRQPSFSLQDLWQIDGHIEGGIPLLSILAEVGDVMRHRKEKGKVNEAEDEESLSSEAFAKCCLYQATIWSQIGVESNASACRRACEEVRGIPDQAGLEHFGLPVITMQVRALVERGKYDEALCTLFITPLLQSLGMSAFGDWQAQVWNTVYKAALQADSSKTLKAVKFVRPEIVKEVEGSMEKPWQDNFSLSNPNEASFNRSNKMTLTQKLLGTLKEAQMLRQVGNEPATSLILACKVMRGAEEADLFRLYRQGTIECAESLLVLDNSTRAKEVMEEVLPQLLVDNDAEMRGKAAWVYARVLITMQRQEESELVTILAWLNRARAAFRESGLVRELSDVLYVQARLYDHLAMEEEKKEVSREFQHCMEEWTSNRERKLDIFDTVQSVIKLVGAQVVAGG